MNLKSFISGKGENGKEKMTDVDKDISIEDIKDDTSSENINQMFAGMFYSMDDDLNIKKFMDDFVGNIGMEETLKICETDYDKTCALISHVAVEFSFLKTLLLTKKLMKNFKDEKDNLIEILNNIIDEIKNIN